MSVINLPLLYIGSKGEKHLDTLFNTGASLSCIDKSHLDELEDPTILRIPRKLYTASKNHFIEVIERVTLDFYIDDVLLSDEFLVVRGLSEEVIIGAATLQKWCINLDFKHNKVEVDIEVAKLQLI